MRNFALGTESILDAARTTPPEPLFERGPGAGMFLTADELASSLGADASADFDELELLANTVRETIETRLGLPVPKGVIMESYPGWCQVLSLSLNPEPGSLSVRYYGTDNQIQTVDANRYFLEDKGVRFLGVYEFPSLAYRNFPIVVEYTSGPATYGYTASLKQAGLLLAKKLWELNDDTLLAERNEEAVNELLRPLRRDWIA